MNIQTWIKEHRLTLLTGMILLAIVFIAVRVNIRFWSGKGLITDTYYAWIEGGRILYGSNPYERILQGNMRENDKYATYFPLFYEASALVQAAGLERFESWIHFWRYFFLISNIGIGLTLYYITYSKKTWGLALFALSFWYFNRWTLYASSFDAIDVIPILLMILSLSLFDRYRRTALLLFSFSLAIKQIGIFLAPLYLIWEYQESRSVRNTISAGLWIVSIPFFSSIPFLFWNFEGFVRSIVFSATRDASVHFGGKSIDTIMNLDGLLARVPMLLVLFGAYFVSWQKSVGRYIAAMLVMGVFIAFNSILFTHYPAWLMPLLPLAASEWLLGKG